MTDYEVLGIDAEELANLQRRLSATRRLVSPTKFAVTRYLAVVVGVLFGCSVAGISRNGAPAWLTLTALAVLCGGAALALHATWRESYEESLRRDIRVRFGQVVEPGLDLSAERAQALGDRAALLTVVLTRRLPGLIGTSDPTRRQRSHLDVAMFRPIPIKADGITRDWEVPIASVARLGNFLEMVPLKVANQIDPLLLLACMDRVERVGDLGVQIFKVARSQSRDVNRVLQSLVGALSVVGDDEFSRDWMMIATQRLLDSVVVHPGPGHGSHRGLSVEDIVGQVVLLRG